jgi:bacteriorhodopsin
LFIVAVAGSAYLVMATGNGMVPLRFYNGTWTWNNPIFATKGSVFYNAEYANSPIYPVFYARYVDWIITTPLILYDLATLAGADRSQIIFVMGLDIMMIGLGFTGAFIIAAAKWAFWLFA